MLSHVISIPFIALHSTHTALQLPQSPLLPCRRNISFPANSYPLKRRKFHLSLNNFFSIFRYFNFLAKMVGNRFTEIVFFVWRPLNSLDGIIPSFAIGCADCQPTCFHSFFLSLFLYFLVLMSLFPVCLVSLLRVVLFYFFFHFFTRMYLYVTCMLLVCTWWHTFNSSFVLPHPLPPAVYTSWWKATSAPVIYTLCNT